MQEGVLYGQSESVLPLKRCCRNAIQVCAKLVTVDWVFLVSLGVITALLSFVMDYCSDMIQSVHIWLLDATGSIDIAVQYLCWVSYCLCLVCIAVTAVQWISAAAIGSGIPEMKTILRGVPLEQCLTAKTLVSKMLGLTLCYGSGIPVGKEGPFVHVSSIVAALLYRLKLYLQKFTNKTRRMSPEMQLRDVGSIESCIAAGCATGVACTFGAPVGGVLFSIEVTSVYFAVRNYWRGFAAALCSALVFRLLAVWFKREATVVAFYRTRFQSDFPFDPYELLIFAVIGAICGVTGALWILTHRRLSLFLLGDSFVKRIISQQLLIYPALVTFLVTTLQFPNGFGQFMGGRLSRHDVISDLFSNFTWISKSEAAFDNMTAQERQTFTTWNVRHVGIFGSLFMYALNLFWMSCLCNTLPIPAGVFMPMFSTGAALGRFIGELMAFLFPNGLRSEGLPLGAVGRIVPGGYAVVGAAAMAGAVTRTISVCVIVFEMTGQIVYIVPVMVAVIVANVCADFFQPSIYDSIVTVKRLPCLSEVAGKTLEKLRSLTASDVMTCDVVQLTTASTNGQLKSALSNTTGKAYAFPVFKATSAAASSGSQPPENAGDLSLPNFLAFSPSGAQLNERRCYQFLGVINREQLRILLKYSMHEADGGDLLSLLDTAPIIVNPHAQLHRIHHIMTLLNGSQAFVIDETGRLLGVVYATALTEILLDDKCDFTSLHDATDNTDGTRTFENVIIGSAISVVKKLKLSRKTKRKSKLENIEMKGLINAATDSESN